MVGLTYALPMTDNFSWGLSMKYALETLGDTKMDNLLLDFGTYYWTGFRDLRIGVTLMNFGEQARPDGEYFTGEYDEVITIGSPGDGQDAVSDTTQVPIMRPYKAYAPPSMFSLGAAMTIYADQMNRLMMSMQLNHPVDNAEDYRFGLEYGFMKRVFLRGGLKLNTDEDPWTAGIGVRTPVAGYTFNMDYSYTEFGLLEQTHRFSLSMVF